MNPIAEKMYARKHADANTRVRPGVGVILRDERGWILFEKRSDNGIWGLPGGGIEPGESIADAARREVKEETGLVIGEPRLIGIYSDPNDRIVTYPDNGDVVQLIDIVVEAPILGGELKCSIESEELSFFSLDALPAEIAPPAWAPLQDVLAGKHGVMR